MDVVHPLREAVQHLPRQDLPVCAGDHEVGARSGERGKIGFELFRLKHGNAARKRLRFDGRRR